MQQFGEAIGRAEKDLKLGTIEAAMKLCKIHNADGYETILLMAAAVELCEPTGQATCR